MSVHDAPDGVGEELVERIRGQVRLAVTLGGIAAEHVARERERAARIAERAAGERATAARGMWEAERGIAVGRLSQVVQDAWWERATPGDVQLAWQDAAAWRHHDERAAGYAETIKGQLRARYGIDPDESPPTEPSDLREARARRDRLAEQVEATVTVGVTDLVAERDVPAAGAGWDTPERRARLAESLRSAGVPVDAAEARLLADVATARPPGEARRVADREGRGGGERRSPRRPWTRGTRPGQEVTPGR